MKLGISPVAKAATIAALGYAILKGGIDYTVNTVSVPTKLYDQVPKADSPYYPYYNPLTHQLTYGVPNSEGGYDLETVNVEAELNLCGGEVSGSYISTQGGVGFPAKDIPLWFQVDGAAFCLDGTTDSASYGLKYGFNEKGEVTLTINQP